MKTILSFFILLIGMSGGSLSADTLKIVALGDSTTLGTPYQADPEAPYTYWVQKQLPHVEILNHGVNGERSDQILKRFEEDVVAHDPDLVIILAGINDLFQNYTENHVKIHLTLLYERAKINNIQVLACTILPYRDMSSHARKTMLQINSWIRDTAKKEGFLFCDTYRLVEHPGQVGQLIATEDGLHPTLAGYRVIGEAIAHVLERDSSGV